MEEIASYGGISVRVGSKVRIKELLSNIEGEVTRVIPEAQSDTTDPYGYWWDDAAFYIGDSYYDMATLIYHNKLEVLKN